MRYLPNKRDALQAHMHKVHKLGNAQTDTATSAESLYCPIWSAAVASKPQDLHCPSTS